MVIAKDVHCERCDEMYDMNRRRSGCPHDLFITNEHNHILNSDCEECDGHGILTFCPSWPDKCRGCEEQTCWKCGGTGLVA